MALRRRKGQGKVKANKNKNATTNMAGEQRNGSDSGAQSSLSTTTRRTSKILLVVGTLLVIAAVVATSLVLTNNENDKNGASSSVDTFANASAPTTNPTAQPSKKEPTSTSTSTSTSTPTTHTASLPRPTENDSTTTAPTTSITETARTTIGSFELLETVPHDATAFTQGLQLVVNNSTTMWEGTGIYGKSELRLVDIPTGQVLKRHALDEQYFGEGISYFTTDENEDNDKGRLIQLTWKKQIGFFYDPLSLQVTGNFTFNTTTNEGWGITYRSTTHEFLVTDGSQFLHTWDATTLQETNKVAATVLREGMVASSSVRMLNELEYDPFTDTVYSNVWFQDSIVRMDVDTGFVSKIYDLKSLFPDRPEGADVLNGIAVTNVPNELWVTGKWWPSMFRIRLIE